jgi:DNA-binding NarL/FixJ family response regulator
LYYDYRVLRSTRIAPVYLLSPHPLVLEEVPRWLPETSFEPVRVPLAVIPSRGWFQASRRSLCVVDACLPPDLIEPFTSALLAACPGVRIIVLIADLGEAVALPLLRLGVKGLVAYSQTRQQLRPALEAVAKGGSWVPRLLQSRLLDTLLARTSAPGAAGPQALSRREREVLSLLLENLSNKEIGDRLSISERTVEFHVSNLLTKFSVPRRTDLVLKSRLAAFEAP